MLSHSSKGLLDRIARVVEEKKTFVLTTHQVADGDGIGAELALREVLERLGKSVLVVNSEALPERYRALVGAEQIRTYSPELHRATIESSDVIVLLDAALPERVGSLAEAVARAQGTTIAIDHHHASGWAELDLIDREAPSATALLHHLFVKLGVTVTPHVATALYLGLVADTGGFRNGAANSEAHMVAAQLLRAGASREQVDAIVLKHWPIDRLRLKGKFLQSLSVEADGQIAWGVLTATDLSKTGQESDATEGFADEALETTGTEISMLFLEESSSIVRIRLRSKNVPVNTLAEKLGGGGHRLAAGARVEGSMGDVVEKTISVAVQYLLRESG